MVGCVVRGGSAAAWLDEDGREARWMDLIIIIIPSKSVRDDKTGQIGRSLCGTKKKKDQTCGKSRRIISSISSIFLKVEKMEKKLQPPMHGFWKLLPGPDVCTASNAEPAAHKTVWLAWFQMQNSNSWQFCWLRCNTPPTRWWQGMDKRPESDPTHIFLSLEEISLPNMYIFSTPPSLLNPD